MATVDDVKDYWEENTPQYWYSKAEPGSKQYYEDIEKYRYTIAYPFLPKAGRYKDFAGKKVLEIGCGQGTDLLQFARNGSQVTGVDLTEGAIGKTRKMFETMGFPLEALSQNAELLPDLEDNTFDVVYSFGVLHHTPKTEQAIDQVFRVLKPGGQAIIMLYSKGSSYLLRLAYHYLTLKFLKQSLQDTINITTEYRGNCPLTKMYSKAEGRAMFKRFEDVRTRKDHWYAYRYLVKPPLPRFITELLSPLESILGDFVIIEGRKPEA